VRSLAQPEVLKLAGTAALACYPRLSLWPHRSDPIWYLEAIIFLGGTVLWAFVFAWHTKYTQRPVFAFKVGLTPFILATLAGIAAAAILHLALDPSLRFKTPEDYPVSLNQWIAMTLFGLALTQLFLVFAPFAWSLRVFQSRPVAILFTILFGIFVTMLKTRSSLTPLPASLFWALILARIVVAGLSLYFYWRGGLLLASWWSLLLQARHLLHFGDSG
jgi:hypothetical protein